MEHSCTAHIIQDSRIRTLNRDYGHCEICKKIYFRRIIPQGVQEHRGWQPKPFRRCDICGNPCEFCAERPRLQKSEHPYDICCYCISTTCIRCKTAGLEETSFYGCLRCGRGISIDCGKGCLALCWCQDGGCYCVDCVAEYDILCHKCDMVITQSQLSWPLVEDAQLTYCVECKHD